MLRWAARIYKRGDVKLVESVREAGDGSPVSEYALIELRRVLLQLNLPDWEAHPNRSREDVHRLFRKAIGRLTPHRGGWQVSR